ncbi:hypothetical protein [Paractinoplanes durhamensis]|uniref:hypothetical protein n=1 Tax=Paractinoplanes durhamensis TaxID=113563 RepID=UPI0031DE8662
MASTRTVVRATGRALASLALIVAGLYLAWRGFLLLHAQLATAHAKPVWGGLGLCAAAVVAVAWGLRMYLPRPRLPLLLGSAVAIDAGLTVLGGAWLVHDQAVAGAIAGGVAAVVPALFLLGLMVFLGDWELYEDDTWQMGIAAAVLAEATAIAVAVTAAVGGHPAPAWIFGSVAALPVAAWLAYALFRMVASALRVSGRRTPPPLTTQLAGLLVPAGAIVAAGIVQTGNPLHRDLGSLFGTFGTWALVLVAAFTVQRLVLNWVTVDIAAEPRYEPAGGDYRRRAEIEDEIGRLQHEIGRRNMRAADYDTLRRLEDRLRDLEREPLIRPSRRPHLRDTLARPAITDGMLEAVEVTAHRTGLGLTAVWPRIELVLPAEARAPFRRGERSVNALRVGVAGAVTTALAVLLLTRDTGPSTLLTAVLGPLLVGAALLAGLRQSATTLYGQRAAAVELYRFDLARSLHLPIPRDPEEFRRAAPVLMGRVRPDELVPTDTTGPAIVNIEQFSGIRDDIAGEIHRTLLPEIRDLQQRQDRLAAQIRNPELDDAQISALAAQAAEQLSFDVRERMETLQQAFYQRVGKLIEDGIEAAVIGPAPANFTGFMVIDRKGDVGRPSATPGEMLTATAGSILQLSFFVMNDENARGTAPTLESGDQFFIAEPITIDGGRPERNVEFDAVADSPTLKPVPNRRGMTVALPAGVAETVFAFQIPDEAGRHEIWFQLYQAGRLVQAVVVHVRAVLAPVHG